VSKVAFEVGSKQEDIDDEVADMDEVDVPQSMYQNGLGFEELNRQ
jgi:hypothetical protein